MNPIEKKLLFIPLIFVFLIVFVQAASVTTSLFYDSTGSNSLTITNGDNVGVIISADSVLEDSMTVTLDLLDSSGNLVNNLLDVYTTNDSYSNYLVLGQSSYLGPGKYTFVSKVTAASGQSDTDVLLLQILPQPPSNNPPMITSTPVTQVNETQSYSYDVNATDADNDTLTYTLTQYPNWLSINSQTGLITGTAPSVNANTNFDVTVRVSDGTNAVSQSYVLTVRNVPTTNNPPVANNQSVITNVNTLVMITLTATDADNDVLTFSIISNPLYGTLSNFNPATGQVIYTPNTGFVGSDSFTFKANDGIADSNIATVSITVNPVGTNNPPVITSAPVTQVNEGANYVYQVVATDADNDTLTYTLTQYPNWLSINPQTGLISGTAPFVAADTNFSVTVSVSDGIVGVSQSYTLIVNNIPSTGNGGARATRGGAGARVISGNEFEEQKYIDQFAPIAGTEEQAPAAKGGNLFWLFLFLLLILLIVVLAVSIFRRLRKEK